MAFVYGSLSRRLNQMRHEPFGIHEPFSSDFCFICVTKCIESEGCPILKSLSLSVSYEILHFDLLNSYHMALQELKRFPTLQTDIAAAANEALERFRDESKKTVLRLVDMESSYLTVEFFRKLHLEPEKAQNSSGPNADRYSDNHFRRIGI